MKASDLIFLETREAQVLASSWPYLKEPRTETNWIALSGLDDSAASLIGILKASGICNDDGTTDPLALQFIAQRMVRSAGLKPSGRAPKADAT